MDLRSYPSEDLLAELIRRDKVRILQVTHQIDGATLMHNLGLTDELRAFKIAQVQAEMARVIAEDVTVQLIGHRKMKTSSSEEIKLTVMLASAPLMQALVGMVENPPSPDAEVAP